MRKHERRRNQEVWKAERAKVVAQWAENARSVDRDAPVNVTAKFAKCAECGVHTRKGVAAEAHAEWHAAEAHAERVRQGDRVVRA